jgi:hypothetical protein
VDDDPEVCETAGWAGFDVLPDAKAVDTPVRMEEP